LTCIEYATRQTRATRL